MEYMRLIFFLLLFGFALPGTAQDLHHVELGVNGLHCSACSFTVEKALRKIPGVSVVEMDLNDRSGQIFFSEGESPDFGELAKAVRDAGYSVRYLTFSLMDDQGMGDLCQFQEICLSSEISGQGPFQVFGKGFVPKKEWKTTRVEKISIKCTSCQSENLIIPFRS
ncbi:MAG: heavy-metal-associated domain-containing protein [Saprospiraceae bacterium]|nr:heavy-metal-associated domain-containing protein [Saprospiraceae bacterium]